ncbi:MAG TPA: nucleoside recognition domain-containing protein, partial [bacterium]|nr:nucleoside recognition domain-containing protein [bacterium]
MPTKKLLPAVVRGFKNAVGVLWLLAKVMVPATLVVTLLDLSGSLDYLSALFAPFMAWFALPGEAAVPLVAGNISGIYAGVGAMVP